MAENATLLIAGWIASRASPQLSPKTEGRRLESLGRFKTTGCDALMELAHRQLPAFQEGTRDAAIIYKLSTIESNTRLDSSLCALPAQKGHFRCLLLP